MTQTLLLENYSLLMAGIINLFMSIFLISRAQQSKMHLYFSLLTLFCFTWTLGLFLSRSMIDLSSTLLFTRSTYVSAIAIMISLLYFVIHFPYATNRLNSIHKMMVWIPAILISILVYSNFFIVNIRHAYSEYEFSHSFYKLSYWIYFIYIIAISLVAVYFLLKKFSITEKLFKNQVVLLLTTIIIAMIFGVYFNLFIIYFGDFRFNWLGPIFTVFMNMAVFRLLLFTKNK